MDSEVPAAAGEDLLVQEMTEKGARCCCRTAGRAKRKIVGLVVCCLEYACEAELPHGVDSDRAQCRTKLTLQAGAQRSASGCELDCPSSAFVLHSAGPSEMARVKNHRKKELCTPVGK